MAKLFIDIEELAGVAIKLEGVLGELGETPYELLKKEQEDRALKSIMEKHVITLNNTLINFFKGTVRNLEASSSSIAFGGCQIYKGGDHLATTCSRLNEPRPKCAKCGMSHRTKKCGVKCSFCSRFFPIS